MSKLFLAVPIFTVLLISSVFSADPDSASRQRPQKDYDGKAGTGDAGRLDRGQGQDHEMHLAQELGLTREQKERFREHKLEVREELTKLNILRDKARREYENVMAANEPDEQAVLSALDELHKVNKDIAILRVRSKRTVNEMLDPTQLNRLNELRASLRERRGRGKELRRRPMRQSPAQPEQRMGPEK